MSKEAEELDMMRVKVGVGDGDVMYAWVAEGFVRCVDGWLTSVNCGKVDL